jgi:hypothetical protein
MTVRLFARGSDGLVAITSGGVTQAVLTEYLNKPKKNISNVFFHSGFDYMQLQAKFSASITLPQRDRVQQVREQKGPDIIYDVPASGVQRHLVGYHGLGYVPFSTSVRGAKQITPTAPIQNVGPSQRLLNIEMDANNVYVYERWLTFKFTLSAITDTYTVWAFRNPQ